MFPARTVPRFLLLLAALFAASLAAADEAADLRKKALELNNITGNDAIDGKVAALAEDAANTKKLLAAAVPMAKEKEQPFSVNALYILGRTAQRLKDHDSGQVFYRAYADQASKLQSGQRQAQAFGGLIDILYETKQFGECVKVCREVLETQGDENLERFKVLVLRRMIQALARDSKADEALKLVNNMIKAQPENWLTLELKGWVLREAGRHEEAAKTYEEVIERIGKDDRLKKEEKEDFGNEVRYLLSGVYVDMKKIDKASEHLKALLAKEPDNPSYNNDLGYIWADHDMNLDEAEKLIRKAIDEDRKLRKKLNAKPEQDKDNAAYLDSLGWVLYKKKKFDEAQKYLEEAAKAPEGQHIEIYDHLGDVLMALGRKAEAVATWKKGVELAGSSKREQERKAQVEKKLKDNE